MWMRMESLCIWPHSEDHTLINTDHTQIRDHWPTVKQPKTTQADQSEGGCQNCQSPHRWPLKLGQHSCGIQARERVRVIQYREEDCCVMGKPKCFKLRDRLSPFLWSWKEVPQHWPMSLQTTALCIPCPLFKLMRPSQTFQFLLLSTECWTFSLTGSRKRTTWRLSPSFLSRSKQTGRPGTLDFLTVKPSLTRSREGDELWYFAINATCRRRLLWLNGQNHRSEITPESPCN